MKKHTTLFLSALLTFAFTHCFAGTFTSLGVGPAAWNGGAASWTIVGDADGQPDSDDDVIVQAGHTITASVSGNCLNLTVDGTLSYTTTGNLNVWGDYTVNGTESGNGNINFVGALLPVRSISGTGTFSTYMRWTFVRNRNIASTVSVTRIAKTRINAGIIVRNSGSMGIRQVELYAGCSWINEAGSTLSINTDATFFTGVNQNIGTFDASAVGNTVIVNSANLDLPNTSAGYYNLTLAFPTSGVKKLAMNTVVLNNLTINANNTLNCNTFDLSVGGNWSKSGLFIASTGKSVTFNGTAAQTLSGSGVTAFTGLTIDNTAGVSLASGSYTLSEVLTLNDGTFNTAGMTFTMLSTAASTARIAPIAGTGAATGNFVIQRFISARDTTYSDLSSPVQSTTFLDWDNELPAISYSTTSFPTQYTYDESADVYVPVTSSGTALSPGQGFEVFLAGSFAYASFPATTMNTIGVPNQGDLPVTISTDVQGWNLVGNPFASSISWASVYSDPGTSNIYDWVEMYDYTIEDWAGFDSGSGVEIGSSQGFWVYGEFASPTLMIPESAKTTSNVSDIRASVKTQPYFNLKISSTSFKFAHNFKVSTSENASDGLDGKDIPFRPSLNKATPQMYCEVDGKNINVNNFNASNDSYSIPLKTKVTVSGNYKLEASGFDFVDYTCIKLQDNLTGKIIDLTTNPYCFTMNSTDNPDRFILLFSRDGDCKSVASAISPTVDFNNQIEVLPTQDGNVINFNLSETVKTNISVRNILGQTIVETISVNASNQSVNINLPEGFSGLYFINIESEKDSVTKKFVKK